MEWFKNINIKTVTTEYWIRKQNRRIHFIISRTGEELIWCQQKFILCDSHLTPSMYFMLLSMSLLINGRMFPEEDEFYSANILYAFFSQRLFKYRHSEQTDIEWSYNMNIRYRIRLFRPTLVKDKGLACLIALLSNVSVETHVDLTAIKCSKGR